MSDRSHLGRDGEEVAASFLAAEGYRIVARNHRTRLGEIDLIAWEGDVLAFIEVRTRRERSPFAALESVGWRKRARLRRLAAAYLQAARLPPEIRCRFDVVAVTEQGGRFTCHLIRGAFGGDA